MKNVNIPKRRVFFRYAALIFLAIHQGLLRQIALPSEKFPRRRAHFQFSNKTQWPHCGLFREECYAHCHWNFLLAPPGDRAVGIFCLLPLGIGLVLEYLCCRIPKRRIWRALPPVLSVLFVVIVGVGRWNMWTSEEVSPVTQLILFPGLPGIFLLIGCYLGWRLWKWFWRPKVIDRP